MEPLLSSLAYFSVFHFPLKKEEILFWRPKDISSGKVEAFLQEALKRKIIEKRGDYYFLSGFCSWVEQRKKRERISQKKLSIAKKEAQFLIKLPGILMVGLSGSVAAANAKENDDIDFFIITQKNRLWAGRFFSILGLELRGCRRRPGQKQVKDKICLNLFLDEAHLFFRRKRHDLYTAHEILQMKPLASQGDIYERFLKANRWVEKFFPFAYRERLKKASLLKSFPLKKSLPTLGGEKFYCFLQQTYMRWRQGKNRLKLVSGQLFFHPHDERMEVLRSYQEILKCLLTKRKASL